MIKIRGIKETMALQFSVYLESAALHEGSISIFWVCCSISLTRHTTGQYTNKYTLLEVRNKCSLQVFIKIEHRDVFEHSSG